MRHLKKLSLGLGGLLLMAGCVVSDSGRGGQCELRTPNEIAYAESGRETDDRHRVDMRRL